MRCCAACFADPILGSLIEKTNAKGVCDFCGRADVAVAESSSLAAYFEPVFDLYAPDESGVPLHQLLQEDWGIFATEDGGVRAALLRDIFDGLGLEDGPYAVANGSAEDPSARWEAFSKELKFENRFLPRTALDSEIFGDFAEQFVLVHPAGGAPLFRARINEDDQQFAAEDMLKPPANVVTNGRANPLGIPYLYVASDADTAIAEVRPHKGDKVTVATFNVAGDIRLYDLRTPRDTASPFRQLDDVARLHQHLPYFELLGNELSRPITPRRANLDYLPSQYLCEVIKQTGLHGILYRSSIAAGFNCVVFADDLLVVSSMDEYEVVEMNYEKQLLKPL